MMTDKEKAIVKLQKLMALAEKAGNENEAASAFSKARALMKKFDISLSDMYAFESEHSAQLQQMQRQREQQHREQQTEQERRRQQEEQFRREEQRLRELQKLAEQRRASDEQRQREQQALRELEKRMAQQSGRRAPEPSPDPVPEPIRRPVPPVRPAQSPRRPAAAQDDRPQLIRRSPFSRLLRPQNIALAVVSAVLLLFVVYVLYLQ